MTSSPDTNTRSNPMPFHWVRRVMNVVPRIRKLENDASLARRRQAMIEAQVRWQNERLLELTLDSLQPTKHANWLADFLQRHNLPADVDATLSPDDRMFQWLYRRRASNRHAIIEYFVSGAQSFGIVDAVATARFNGLGQVDSVLDFASGYGKLVRYLVRRMEPGRVWTSDIKAGGVAFQEKQFGVHGIVSAERPEDFQPDRRFDIIFVGSLFSHLPEATFRPWLQRLWELLGDRGVLAFSAHDLAKLGRDHTGDFAYMNENEDVYLDSEAFLGGADGILDTAAYGSMWVSEAFVARAVQEACGGAAYARYPGGVWGGQDLYLISPAGVEDLRTLTYLDYPHVVEQEKSR